MNTLIVMAVLALAQAPGAEKIVGGTATTGHPAVGVIYDEGGPSAIPCTATLVGPRWVITAPACAALADAVIFGSDVTVPQPVVTLHDVVEVIVHPGADGVDNGIALMRLENPPQIRPVVLDLRALVAADVGLRGTMVGWGSSDPDEDSSGVKRQAAGVISALDGNHFLVQGANSSTCYGDAGGPFLVGGRMLGMALFFTGEACDSLSGFHRMDTVAEFLLSVAPLCTVQTPCVAVFAHGFES